MAAAAALLSGCAGEARKPTPDAAPAMSGVPPGAVPATPQAPPAMPAPVPAPLPPAAAGPVNEAPAVAPDARQAFADLMARRGLDRGRVLSVLGEARFSPTVARLVLPPSSPSVRSWPRYRARFVETRRIREGMDFWEDHAGTLAQAERQYGVPASVIVAIIGVETFYGRITGNFRILDALSTLAFDYPAQARSDRSDFFREELAQFLLLCDETGMDPLAVRGSYAGAIGLPQFMPGSIRRFAADGDGDGRIDLLNSPDDAIMSVASFLLRHGWQAGQPVFLPVRLPPDPAALVDGGLRPTLDWPRLAAAGARPARGADEAAWRDWPLAVIDLLDGATGRTEYRVAAPNFFAITEYNRSYFYAASVADLADELQRRRE
ncbi:lytic murein transglycosylase B [Pigmentiphaga soli]|uniref:Lytic murein transglycosylase B n=1 Tax=Pigmentiphaga soli TaxID=1007095 RepID=A0ABP8GYE2_9BURK